MSDSRYSYTGRKLTDKAGPKRGLSVNHALCLRRQTVPDLTDHIMKYSFLCRTGLSLALVTLLLACGPEPDAAAGTDPAGAGLLSEALLPQASAATSGVDAEETAAESTPVYSQQSVPETAPEPVAETGQTDSAATSSVGNPATGPDPVGSAEVAQGMTSGEKYQPLEDIHQLQNGRRTLDLSLPSMNWDDEQKGDFNNSQSLPDVFRYKKPENGMNLSGKLHWDEDEEATHMSLEESIKGAEVELQFRLP